MRNLVSLTARSSPSSVSFPTRSLGAAVLFALAGTQGCGSPEDASATATNSAKGTGGGASGLSGSGGGLGTGGRIGTTGPTGNLNGNEPVDPTITFDWSVDNATTLLACKSGHYSGKFAGTYTSAATYVGIPVPVTGDVDLRLNESTSGEFFVIENGHIKGTADKFFPYDCDMTGTLDCTTKKLENGNIVCRYRVISNTYTFSGPLGSAYNPASQSFESGTWSGKEPNVLPHMGGKGTWDATWDGP